MRRFSVVPLPIAALGLVSTLGLFALLPACSGDETPSSTTVGTANVVSDDTLDPADPLAYVTFRLPAAPQCVALGHRFAVEVDAEPSAGRQWRVTAPPGGQDVATSIVVLGGTEFVGVPGGDAEQQRLTFAAANVGEADVTVQYVGADGSPVADTATETWHIIVTLDGACPPPPVPETTIAPED